MFLTVENTIKERRLQVCQGHDFVVLFVVYDVVSSGNVCTILGLTFVKPPKFVDGFSLTSFSITTSTIFLVLALLPLDSWLKYLRNMASLKTTTPRRLFVLYLQYRLPSWKHVFILTLITLRWLLLHVKTLWNQRKILCAFIFGVTLSPLMLTYLNVFLQKVLTLVHLNETSVFELLFIEVVPFDQFQKFNVAGTDYVLSLIVSCDNRK